MGVAPEPDLENEGGFSVHIQSGPWLNWAPPRTLVPIGSLKGENPEVEQLFPQSPERPSDWTGSALKVTFPEKYTAALYRLVW